jgi:lysophospholipid acyltransferase (LPLAT)-like uncharacterized protein
MVIRPSPRLVRVLTSNLYRTLRFHLFGTDHLFAAARQSPTGTFIACHWHQSLLTILGPHRHMRLATMASRSRDGDITAAYLESVGIRVVRGSSSRGGAEAAHELMRALHEGFLVALNVDGPRGPFKQVKPGVVEIARRCGVPVIPLVGRATREVSFKRSWDRFRLPLPLAHVAILYGQPLWFTGSEPSPDELRARCHRLGAAMHALESQASRLAGRSD